MSFAMIGWNTLITLVWLACSVLAALRVLLVEKKKLKKPDVQDVPRRCRGLSVLAFFLTPTFFGALFLVVGLLMDSGMKEAETISLMVMLMISIVAFVLSFRPRLSLWMAPLAFAALDWGIVLIILAWMAEGIIGDFGIGALTDSGTAVFSGTVCVLLSSALACRIYLRVMRKSART